VASESTHEIFWKKHRIDRQAIASLTDADIDRIEAIAQGRIDSPHRVRALDVVVAARGVAAVDTLIETADEESLDPALRAAAVIQLGRVGGPEAERALIELAGQAQEPSIRLRTAQALAKTANPDALSAFDALVEDESPLIRRRARFARSVLAYRHGIAGFELAAPAEADLLPPPNGDVVDVRMKPASRRAAVAALADVERDSYGVLLTQDAAYAIECASTKMLLALDRSIEDAIAAAHDHPRLLGVVAEHAPEAGSYSVRWLVFSTPAERAPWLSLHRQSGEQVLYGPMDVEHGSARFELSAVATVGNPAVSVAGVFTNGRLSLSGVSATSVGVAKRSGQDHSRRRNAG
jgi:hypothetical protein